jgi:uncharacterized repeat protein (TIGR02543 family)
VSYTATDASSGAAPIDQGVYQIGNNLVVRGKTSSMMRVGYSFAGWALNPAGTGTIYNSGETIAFGTSNIALYATWTAKTYIISFAPNGGSGSASASSANYATGGSAVSLPTVGTLSRIGFTFGGWSLTPTGSLLTSALTTTENLTVYAIWNIKTIQITYDRGIADSSVAIPSAQSGAFSSAIVLGDPGSLSTTISSVTYVFVGWYDGSSTYARGSSYALPSAPLVLVAQWVRTLEVRYSFNGGTPAAGTSTADSECDPITALCTDGQVIAANAAPTRAGYQFSGWATSAGSIIAAGANFQVNLNSHLLFASWVVVPRTITYVTAAGVAVPTQANLTIGEQFLLAAAPTRAGYTFSGWSDGTTVYGALVSYGMGAANVVLTAQWTPNTYVISYDWNGGTGPATANQNYTVGTVAYALPTAAGHSRDGFVFEGWSLVPGGTSLGSTFQASGSMTLFAIWGTGNFTITYNSNWGSASLITASVVSGSTLALRTPTRNNFVFNGWFDAPTGGNLIGVAAAPITPLFSRTLYARWTQLSLYGVPVGSMTRLGTVFASGSADAGAFGISPGGSRVDVLVPRGALPVGTAVNIDYVSDMSRAQTLISISNNYLLSVVVSWIAPDGTVPDTSAGLAVSVTFTDSRIKAGQTVYSLLGSQVVVLGIATQDGTVTVTLISDPEIVIASTRSSAPVSVTATTAANAQSVITWTPPSHSGGSDVIEYTVTSSGGQSCTTQGATTCTVTGLTNGTSYTFTVTATNSIGTSAPSAASSSITPRAPGASGGSGSRPGSGRVPAPVVPTNPAIPVTQVIGPVGSIAGSIEKIDIVADATKRKLIVSASDWKIDIKPQLAPNRKSSLTDKLSLVIQFGSEVAFLGTGLGSNAKVSVFMSSEAVPVGEVETLADGSFASSMQLPVSLLPGNHTLLLVTTDAAGHKITLNLPITVMGKITVGTFRGFIAIFSKDLMGQRLSANVAGRWLVRDPILGFKAAGYSRQVRFTGAGRKIFVDLYLNGIFIKRQSLTTR